MPHQKPFKEWLNEWKLIAEQMREDAKGQ